MSGSNPCTRITIELRSMRDGIYHPENERKISLEFYRWPQPFPHENEMKDRISRWFDARNDIFFLDECDTLSPEKLRFLIKIPGDNYCRVLFLHLRDLLLIRDIYWRSGM